MVTTNIHLVQSKSQIIQRLLEEKHITVEEAMTLMMTEKEIQYIPTIPQTPCPNYPTYPNPFGPFYYSTTSDSRTQK